MHYVIHIPGNGCNQCIHSLFQSSAMIFSHYNIIFETDNVSEEILLREEQVTLIGSAPPSLEESYCKRLKKINSKRRSDMKKLTSMMVMTSASGRGWQTSDQMSAVQQVGSYYL